MSGTAIYSILDIKPNASQETIKAAYRVKAMERHPDRNPDDPEAGEKFARVKKAYDLLSNVVQRRAWHRRHNLVWLWEKVHTPDPDLPPEGLNRACLACKSISHRCAVCSVGFCVHHGMMLELEGSLPRPVCVACKQLWEDREYAHWKLQLMVKRKLW